VPPQPVVPRLTPNDLAEFVEEMSPATGSLSWEEGAEQITYIIPYQDPRYANFFPGLLYHIRMLLLGYSWTETKAVSPGSTPNGGGLQQVLRRQLPMAHPQFPWMVCTRVDSWQGVGPRGKMFSTFTLPTGPTTTYQTSKYAKLKVVASFTQPKYELLNDVEGVYNENRRYTWRENSASANFIVIDQGSMVFTKGPSAGNPFVAPGYAQAEVMETISIYWTRVPTDYVLNNNGDPIRWLNALQKVNSQTFLGYPAGTLLMDSYEYTYYRSPMIWTDAQTRFWCELKANFKYFDPPYGSYLSPPANGGIMVGGTPRIVNLSSVAALTVGDTLIGLGIQPGTKITAIDYVGGVVTMDKNALYTVNGVNVNTSASLTKRGHLTAPAGLAGYYPIATAANSPGNTGGQDRYQSYDFSLLYLPLTDGERNT